MIKTIVRDSIDRQEGDKIQQQYDSHVRDVRILKKYLKKTSFETIKIFFTRTY